MEKFENRIEKREDCRKQAETKGLDHVERLRFIEECVR